MVKHLAYLYCRLKMLGPVGVSCLDLPQIIFFAICPKTHILGRWTKPAIRSGNHGRAIRRIAGFSTLGRIRRKLILKMWRIRLKKTEKRHHMSSSSKQHPKSVNIKITIQNYKYHHHHPHPHPHPHPNITQTSFSKSVNIKVTIQHFKIIHNSEDYGRMWLEIKLHSTWTFHIPRSH